MKNNSPIIVWFRQDLRLRDNPALLEAAKTKQPILPVYILDDDNSAEWKMGSASRWWLHQSLTNLNIKLSNTLYYTKGNPFSILSELIRKHNVSAVYWNRCYEPWQIARDKHIEHALHDKGIICHNFNGSLLFEPHEVLKDDHTPYKVFTPFYKKGYLNRIDFIPSPSPLPSSLNLYHDPDSPLNTLKLMPEKPWYASIKEKWSPGEGAAQTQLKHFLETGLRGYKEGRNYPAQSSISQLSPYLHFGEISPRDVWHTVHTAMLRQHCEEDGLYFLSELGWREFSYHLLYHFPDLPHRNFQQKFDAFPWHKNKPFLDAWKKGNTGYPIIDAGMRELWKTGFMHNRVRMIVASFLTKNLRLHWQHGARWFWDTLVDADLANNSSNWQWVAGCGADAAPYFRIFNPVTQGKKFDQHGIYIRHFVPELATLPDKFLHHPWEAPKHILAESGITLGDTYPTPIVDLKISRKEALQAFNTI